MAPSASSSGHQTDGDKSEPMMVSRRQALKLGGAVTAATAVGPLLPSIAHASTDRDVTVAQLLRPEIRPRTVWAGDLPVGDLTVEEDVRFLLVHHTASSNSYGQPDVAGAIRDFYAFHTGPEKGWPDVAYNFFIDRFGTIWEGRSGSIQSAVRGDATGGSQGFALLAALIGDHSSEPISAEALASLTHLFAWLGEKYDVNTVPGSTVEFTSRGSNKWPAGTLVTARTISGHREMSATQCPGDLAFSVLDQELPAAVTTMRSQAKQANTTTTTTTTPTTATPTTTTQTTTSASPAEQTAANTSQSLMQDQASSDLSDGQRNRRWTSLAWGGALVAALGAGGAAIIKRGTKAEEPKTDNSTTTT